MYNSLAELPNCINIGAFKLKVLDVYIMFHVFDFNFKWIPGNIPESVMEKVNVLMRDDVDNVLLYRKIVLDLAA